MLIVIGKLYCKNRLYRDTKNRGIYCFPKVYVNVVISRITMVIHIEWTPLNKL